MSGLRGLAKDALAKLPLTAEFYQRLRGPGGVPGQGYSLERLTDQLPTWAAAIRRDGWESPESGRRRILVFGCLQWWLEHAVALALLLRAEGHQVDLAYLPYRRWDAEPHPFELRRQWAYLAAALSPLAEALGLLPLHSPRRPLPPSLVQAMEDQSRLDVQYTLAREEIDWRGEPAAAGLLELRRRRNLALARAAHSHLHNTRYDAIVIPNGSILELGALYRTARMLGAHTVTYEFGEQRGRLWLAQDDEVMRLPMDGLWGARGGEPLQDAQLERLRQLYRARRGGIPWSQFARRWQRSESQGARSVRQQLGLAADKTTVLLCTNVVGDSLALDRQVFSRGMADWLAETVRFFAGRPDVQLVVRVHPGEMLGAGHPSVEIVRTASPQVPEHVVVVPPESTINTYDLIELAQLGLVYTSTVGLEMAMMGVPVVVGGATHYRGKGFTFDPVSMPEYLDLLQREIQQPSGNGLPQHQVELAWRYAHLFFFDFPFAFPWHLLFFWEDLSERPLPEVLGAEEYRRTLSALSGEPIDWGAREPAELNEVGV